MKVRTLGMLAVVVATLGCGQDGKSGSQEGQTGTPRSGHYALGDEIQFRVEREGTPDPKVYDSEGVVTHIEGSRVEVKWSDFHQGTRNLIHWNGGANPEVERVDFNTMAGPQPNQRTSVYEPEERREIETPAGKFSCVYRKYAVTEKEIKSAFEVCATPEVAISRQAYWKKTTYRADGTVEKSVTYTLTKNAKH